MLDKTMKSDKKGEGFMLRRQRITATGSQLHLARVEFAGLQTF